MTNQNYCPFPTGFLWGAATAAYQLEGAAQEDGRGPSVWDVFSRRPGAIAMDHNGDRSTDHYHRYKEDVALMKELGLKAYRFSVSWSRIFPDGVGKPNPAGLDFYQRLVDELLAAGIQPWMTLFHWDLPQALEDRFGGWESKDCAQAFADYTSYTVSHLHDRLSGIFTINEFMCFLDKGYGASEEVFAPGKRATRRVLNQARHHAIYAHGLAVQAIRAISGNRVPVGLAENIDACVPVRETPEDIRAAKEAMRARSGMFLTPIMEGAYHPSYLDQAGPDAPHFTDEEMRTISTPIDFLGFNLYAPTYIRAAPESPAGWAEIPCDENYPRLQMPWLFIGPSILYWTPRFASELWKVPAIYITENGAAYPDRPDANGEIWDTARAMYLQQYLTALHRAVAEGHPVRGYFCWSLMDNFEWAFGYTRRFGICYVNYETLERTPKLSARVYSDIIRRNAVGA
ncbi:MAG TPA: GH1 family beta-glucosidase [Chthoniobacteraceae bacterium]|jgi:beta-glucosidase|nr:GH1 family beta-glucosidase [Chthoniobacteraceae bacterium]